MNKEIITVPSGVRYISNWGEYSLPQGHCIVDKGVTGCGYTEYCLGNNENVVLCSPRKLLLENKSEQHAGEKNILYLKNDIKDFQGSKSFEERIKEHVRSNLLFDPKTDKNRVGIKLLVTYDSAFRVSKVLKEMGLQDQFYFVVDEFQSIFLDSYFKSNVEMDFVEDLQGCKNVLYLSATPMLEKYLDQLPEFKDLPYYELDWSETGVVEKLILKRKFTTSLASECSKIIQSYLNGKFEITVSSDNHLVVSKEAVFYFNSIGDITKVIKKNDLRPDQVNIICADSKENMIKLSKLSTDLLGDKQKHPDRFEIGKIPLKGQPNKMFTFCTKTAYIGSDFYSKCARSFVFADPNISCLALDISLDLPQIAGRQRDKDNPFKNDITIFYRTIRKENLFDRTKFDELQKNRQETTKLLLDGYFGMQEKTKKAYLVKLKSDIQVSQYTDDFVSISKHTNEPVYNTFIEVANERAWEVSQKDYQDQINVTKAFEEVSSEVLTYLDENEKIAQDFLDNHFYQTGLFHEKMKMYCEFMDSHRGNMEIEDIIYFKIRDERFRKYYNFYGTSGCKAVSYKEASLYEGMFDATKEDELTKAIYNRFKVGERYTKKDIKENLGVIYRDLGITSKSPKATDLGKYFNLVRTKIQKPDDPKKYSEGYRLEPLN